jgi:RNA polymerase sigma-70 factor, ECF subfamily
MEAGTPDRGRMNSTPAHSDWRRWLDDHAPKFLLFARQQARSDADAQDLVQEALVEAMQRQHDGAPPPSPLVFATIRRRAIDLARSEDRRAQREQTAYAATPEWWFDTSVEDRELGQLMQNAMSRLPDMYREVISLKVWGELTFAEIAEALDIPPNTAASRYRYGLTELRRLAKEVFA